MMSLPKQNDATTYTGGLKDSALSAQVIRIVSGLGRESFQTSAFEAAGNIVWLEAWREPDSKFWTVSQFVEMPFEENAEPVIQNKNILEGVCFFDALQACCSHEQMKMSAGLSPTRSGGTEKTIHWAKAASEAGQAIDFSGYVQPCAYGRPLVEGAFAKSQYEIAQRSPSPDVKLVNSATLKFPSDKALQKIFAKAAGNDNKIPGANMDDPVLRLKQTKMYDNVIELGDESMEFLGEIIRYNFNPVIYKTKAKIILSITAGLPLLIPRNRQEIRKYWDFDKKVLGKFDEFNTAASQLPDEPARALCERFTSDLKFAFWSAWAIAIRDRDFKAPEDQYTKMMVECLDKATKVKELSRPETSKFYDYYAGGKGCRDDIKQSLVDVWGRRGAYFSGAKLDDVIRIGEAKGLRQYLELSK